MTEEVAKKRKKLQLNAAQREAVEYLGGPLLVLAGPGTGKTQLLSEKVVYILENTDTNPENILCLTFTDSGASNMRERLRSIIKGDAAKVNIGTYHAFGREILAQYQRYAEKYTRLLDASIDEVAQHKIVRGLLEDLPAFDILRGDSVKDVIDTISEAKAAGLKAADLAQIAEQNMADAEVISGTIAPLLANVVPRNFKKSYEGAYRPIFELLQGYGRLEPILGRVERSIAGMVRDLTEAMERAEEKSSVKPLSDWKNAYFEKDGEGNYRLNDRVANLKLASVARVMAKYQEYLEKQGLFDYDDMIVEAVKVLKEDKGFKLTLEERYQFILLDEFQDTNPSQFAIVKALTDYEQPMVMAVGDDDQAIYEFQGALSSNLTDFQEYYGAKVVALTENYRSTQEILDFSREIIRQAPDRFADKKLVAHKGSPERSKIRRIEFQGSEAECAFIAEEITRLIEAGVPQSEIAVISHKTKYFEPLLPFLKAKPGIQIAYERKEDLLEEPLIHQILTILGYAEALGKGEKPKEQLMEILTFPMFKLKPLEIAKKAAQARKEHRNLFEMISEDEKFRATAEWLAEVAVMVLNEPLEVVVHEIVQKIDAAGISSADEYERYVFYENVASLLGKVKRHFGEKKLKAADLLEMVEDYREAQMKLGGVNPYRDADEAVQILTAHKAKGLEFRYVFVIAADHKAWGKGKGNNNLLALPKNLRMIRHTGTTDSEQLRVLYVALTRAKEGLFITNSRQDFSGKSPERLEYLGEYEQDGEVISPYLPSRTVELRYEAGTPKKREQNMESWLAIYRPESPEMREIYRENLRDWRMSATALTSFVDIMYAGPQQFFKNYVLKAPREPENESLAFGDLVHKTFEAVTKEGLSDEQAIGFYLEELEKKDLETKVQKLVRERGTEGLGKALAQFGPILRQGQAEVNLGAENLAIDGIPVTGKIDHLVVHEDTKTLEVYDFKTGNYHKEKWEKHPTLFKYMLQLGFYKLLLNNSREFRDYDVSQAHILFVTPDRREGKVYDKLYEYNEADEKYLREVMEAVYALVTSLRFLDDEEIMVKANPTRKLKDVQDFIKLLVAKNTIK